MTDYDIDIDLARDRAATDHGEDHTQARASGKRASRGSRAAAKRPGRKAPKDDTPAAIDPVDQYLRSLGAPPVLSKDETTVLAKALEKARNEFLDEMYGIPGTAIALVDRWNERKSRGHVTAALSAHYRDGSGRDYSAGIDRALGRLERLLERREELLVRTSRGARSEREDVEQKLAKGVAAAEVDFEIVLTIYREMLALRGVERTRAVRAQRRRLGLSEVGHRRHLERAEKALARMDETKQTFVYHNLRLVIKQAKRFRQMGVPYADLIQEGNLGLIRAVEKFDYTLGYKFSTYAVWWIEQALVRAVQNGSRTVRVPTHVYDLEVRARKIREQLRSKLGRAPQPAELAEAMNVSETDVIRARHSMQPIKSTHATLPGSEEFTLEDVLADEAARDPIEEIDQSEISTFLGERMEQLDPRARMIVEAHYGLGEEEPQTLQQIGDRLGLSRERVRQIESRALAQLRSEGGFESLAASLGLG
jgi:RNA polymerase sigma factor (sigma-70 family)